MPREREPLRLARGLRQRVRWPRASGELDVRRGHLQLPGSRLPPIQRLPAHRSKGRGEFGVFSLTEQHIDNQIQKRQL
jgi:hypothetical protein